jgi:hypothetical protein
VLCGEDKLIAVPLPLPSNRSINAARQAGCLSGLFSHIIVATPNLAGETSSEPASAPAPLSVLISKNEGRVVWPQAHLKRGSSQNIKCTYWNLNMPATYAFAIQIRQSDAIDLRFYSNL